MAKKKSIHGEVFGLFRRLGKTPPTPTKFIDLPSEEQIMINKGLLPKKVYPGYK